MMFKMRIPSLRKIATDPMFYGEAEKTGYLGHWVTARPWPFTGFQFKKRLRLALGVFTGKYDAISWDLPLEDWFNNLSKGAVSVEVTSIKNIVKEMTITEFRCDARVLIMVGHRYAVVAKNIRFVYEGCTVDISKEEIENRLRFEGWPVN